MSATHNIHVATDPTSKIRFLETTLDGQDWRATLIFEPSNKGLHHANQTARLLKSRGFLVTHGRDKEGHVTLEAHRTGYNTNMLGLFKEYGLFTGAAHTIANPLLPLQRLYHASFDGVNEAYKTLKNPVRLGAVSYIAADIGQSLTGGSNQDAIAKAGGTFGKVTDYFTKLKNPKNFTQSVSGMFFLLQSVLYLKYAKTGTELSVDDLNRAYKQAQKNGKDINDVESWTGDLSSDKHRITPKIIRDYPIQAGAVIQNIGMALLFSHQILHHRYNKELLANPAALSAEDFKFANRYVNKGGFALDMYRTVASFAGWAFLMYPIKEHPKKSNNVVERAFQEFEENPQRLSSAVATSTSIAGAISGGYFKGNKTQFIAESLYVPGDLLLSQAKNTKFGASDEANANAVREAVEQFIAHSPMVLGPEARREFSVALAEQLLNQSAHYELERAKPGAKEALEAKLKEAHGEMIAKLKEGEELADPRYDRFIDAAKNLLVRFPSAKREQALDAIVQVGEQLPNVFVNKEELRGAFNLEQTPPSAHHAQPVQHINALSTEISALANIVPSAAGDIAGALYDRLQQVLATPAHAANTSARVDAKTVQHLQQVGEQHASEIG